MSRLTRDGTAEPVSRDQILRCERGREKLIFPVHLTTSRIGIFIRLIHTLAICVAIHTYIHTAHHPCVLAVVNGAWCYCWCSARSFCRTAAHGPHERCPPTVGRLVFALMTKPCLVVLSCCVAPATKSAFFLGGGGRVDGVGVVAVVQEVVVQ